MSLVNHYRNNVSKEWQGILDDLDYPFLLRKLESRMGKDLSVPRNVNTIVNPFIHTKLSDTKVVIVSGIIDPENRDSNGMWCGSFGSSNQMLDDIRVQLRNELTASFPAIDNSLSSWTKQGVLLLNAAPYLRVSDGPILAEEFWDFTANLLDLLDNISNNRIVFIYVDYMKPENVANPYKTIRLITRSDDILGSGIFGECNRLLHEIDRDPIHWESIKKERKSYDLLKLLTTYSRNTGT